MFTIPDTTDAVATCPALSPVGPTPQGFFADCNPGTGFAGTRPIAEHFNELILNLRALLTEAGVPAVKGDPTMLWKSILRIGAITSNVTLNVIPTGGAAEPANPLAGDPFDTLQHAIGWLARYRIAVGAAVTIQIATGTYNSTARIVFYHADGSRVTIRGNGQSATILNHTGAIGGMIVWGALGNLQDLTIQGDGSGGGAGDAISALWVAAGAFCQLTNVTLKGFAYHGLVVDGGCVGVANGATLTTSNNHAYGINLLLTGSLNATGGTLESQNNTLNQILLQGNATLTADTVHTVGGSGPGLLLGSGTTALIRKLGVDVCGTPPNAIGIMVSNGAHLVAFGTQVAGDWWTWSVTANQPQIFQAEFYGLIRAYGAMAANNKANCSPAINTLGNTQAYIQAS
jgi:hypothetical protein